MRHIEDKDHYQHREEPYEDQHPRRDSNYKNSKIRRHIEWHYQWQDWTPTLQTITNRWQNLNNNDKVKVRNV